MYQHSKGAVDTLVDIAMEEQLRVGVPELVELESHLCIDSDTTSGVSVERDAVRVSECVCVYLK